MHHASNFPKSLVMQKITSSLVKNFDWKIFLNKCTFFLKIAARYNFFLLVFIWHAQCMKVQVKVLPTKSVIERRWGWSKLMCVCTEDQMRVQLLPHLHTVTQNLKFEVFF